MQETMVTEKSVEPLRLADRCDRCGAQAFVRVTINSSELLFCGHHFALNEVPIAAAGYGVQDERNRINERSESSANN